jgi:hypothetical protein
MGADCYQNHQGRAPLPGSDSYQDRENIVMHIINVDHSLNFQACVDILGIIENKLFTCFLF